MATVFITDGQLRSALAAVRSLGRQGHTVICGEKTRYTTTFASKYVDRRVVYPSPEKRPKEFVDSVLSVLQNNEIDVLLPIGHEATRRVNENTARLRQHTTVPVPGAEKFNTFVRKNTTLHRAARLGIPHPKTKFPEDVDDAVKKVADLEFPVVIKPIDSYGSQGLVFVKDPDKFRVAYERTHSQYPTPVIQERLPRAGQGLCAAFLIWDGTVKAQFAYRRLREYPPDGGPSTLRESIDAPQLLDAGRELLLDADWTGVAMVEFKDDIRDNTPKLMEVNPRFWGSLHLPYYAGVDFPKLVVQHALDKPTSPVLDYESDVQCRYLLPGDLLWLASKRNYRALREFLPLRAEGVHYDIVDRDDPRPILGRLAAIARYSIDTEMWRNVVFRSSTQ